MNLVFPSLLQTLTKKSESQDGVSIVVFVIIQDASSIRLARWKRSKRESPGNAKRLQVIVWKENVPQGRLGFMSMSRGPE